MPVLFFGGLNAANDILLQPDGKILVAGTAEHSGFGYDIVLVRFNPSGDLDGSFGTSGKVSIDYAGGVDAATAIALNPDGKIYVTGYLFTANSGYDFGVIRLTSTGALDTSFNGTGIVDMNVGVGTAEDIALDVVIQPDGKVVAGGYSPVNGVNNFTLLRYLPMAYLM